MKQYNTFQKALLEAQLQQFADVPEVNVTEINKRKTRPRLLRNGLIAAAVLIVLTGSIFAAVRFALDAEVKELKLDTEYFENNRVNSISINADIALPDAPEHIETYMLPSYYASKETLLLERVYLSDGESGWYPHGGTFWQDKTDPPQGKIQTIHAEWDVGGSILSFYQSTAKSKEAGEAVLNIHYDINEPVEISYEAITIDDTEVFCYYEDWSKCDWFIEQSADTCDTGMLKRWFWTDGYYLYELCFPMGFSEAECLKIFESIRPVEDIYDYLSIEE